MENIKVEWSDEDLMMMISSLGFEPTYTNMHLVKSSRLERNMKSAMTIAGWEAMKETVLIALKEE